MSISKEFANLVYLGICFFTLWGASVLARRVERGKRPPEIEGKDDEHNMAIALRHAGLYLGIGLGLAGVLAAPSRGFGRDLLGLLVYAPLTVALFFVAWRINDRWILPALDNTAAILKGNVAVGLVEAGAFLASGLVLKAAFSGQGGFWTGVIFFLLGQLVLVGFFKLMELLTPFNDQREIEDGNPALGLHFAGMLAALGFILAASVTGDFTKWSHDLAAFFWAALKGGALLLLASWATDKIFLLHSSAAVEISEERNCAAVLAGLGVKISVAVMLVSLL